MAGPLRYSAFRLRSAPVFPSSYALRRITPAGDDQFRRVSRHFTGSLDSTWLVSSS